jgi:hypothetical protein
MFRVGLMIVGVDMNCIFGIPRSDVFDIDDIAIGIESHPLLCY